MSPIHLPLGLDGASKLARRRRLLAIVLALLLTSLVYARYHLPLPAIPYDLGQPISLLNGADDDGRASSFYGLSISADPNVPKPVLPAYCDGFPDDRIVVAVKTGATEAMAKLPIQLLSSLQCVRDPLFFSDLNQTLGAYRIHDVLTDFPPALMQNNPDFDLYFTQQEMAARGHELDIPSLAARPNPRPDWRTPNTNAAWALDKYKFLHMVERAWALQPDRDWYVFIEADTYLSFANLHRWLADYDPSRKLYFGEPVLMTEHDTPLWFAYGGAGFVLSGAAMRSLCVDRRGVAHRFAPRIADAFFGDFVLADALEEELGLRITDALPHLNPDSPAMIAFDQDMWCQPAVTMHHLDARTVDSMHRAEREHDFGPFLFRDVYTTYFYAGLPAQTRGDWNAAHFRNHTLVVPPKNIKPSKPYAYMFYLWDPHEKAESCALACEQNPACYAWTFIDSEVRARADSRPAREARCHLSSALRLGRARTPEWRVNDTHSFETTWTSGWLAARAEKFVAEHDDCSPREPDLEPPRVPFDDVLDVIAEQVEAKAAAALELASAGEAEEGDGEDASYETSDDGSPYDGPGEISGTAPRRELVKDLSSKDSEG